MTKSLKSIVRTSLGLRLALLLLPSLLAFALATDGWDKGAFADSDGIARCVVINEVAWMGTQAFVVDEWIELKNNTTSPIDLTGWVLVAGDGTPSIALNGVIPAQGYFLLERTNDSTVSDIPADQIYTGALKDDGEVLTLRDAAGNVIDTANGNGGAWPAGDKDTRSSMERVDPTVPDDDANWGTNDGVTRNGLDANGNPLNGTPKASNSVTTVPGPPFAPSTVTVSANPAIITADGVSTSAIAAVVKDVFDNDVADGTVVTFATSLGTFVESGSHTYATTTAGGAAMATLRSSRTSGVAAVTATSDSASGQICVEFSSSIPVGGVIIPVSKLELLAPWIGLAVVVSAIAITLLIGSVRRASG